MRAYDIIRRKRDGEELTDGEIRFFVRGYTEGDIPDYQASAFLMAAFLRGLSFDETVSLTDAIVHSGRTLDLGKIPGVKADQAFHGRRRGRRFARRGAHSGGVRAESGDDERAGPGAYGRHVG